ncbi:SH3-like domain-containing protein [Bradyrhizobium sp. USDA 326]|uniref:peptidase C39 family protein n=1 Tax=Bradyrhizobium sp. USDA 326 TaxID=3377726 RepID=UPI003C75451F
MSLSTSNTGAAEITRKISLYRQRRNYTCGPSSVMMVMSALNPEFRPNETAELEIWREATTIHGGCGPIGLALSLNKRGAVAHTMLSHDGAFLECRASTDAQKEAMRILQHRDLSEAKERGVDIAFGDYSISDLMRWMHQGWHPIAMVSIQFEGATITHWVVVTGITSTHVLLNDPLKSAHAENDTSAVDVASFDKMSRFGPHDERAIVLAGPPELALASSPFS